MDFNIKKYHWIALLIFSLAIFLRIFKIVDGFEFAHDGDLYSWIVKDIAVNHHFRLVGQETSASGIFIGPLFYYSLVPFFLITSMDPIGALIFAAMLSIVTLISFYLVFCKLFNKTVGLVALFLQAILISRVGWDRWVVPTITTSLWEVGYLFTIVNLARGKFWVLPILGFLIGLIWHINFFLIPTLLAIPVALFFAKKIPKLKEIISAMIAFFIPMIPYFIFEVRHNFSQTKAFITSFTIEGGGGTGGEKLLHVLDQISGNVVALFFYPVEDPIIPRMLFLLLLLFTGIILVVKKAIDKKELMVLYSWIVGVVAFFTFSSKIISEYYLNNINIIFIVISAIGLNFLITSAHLGKLIFIIIIAWLSIYNIPYFLTKNYSTNWGYKARKEIAEFIVEDSKFKGFPCVAVSYITIPGENVGFRYFFYLFNLHVNQPISGSPVYTIVLPATLYNIKPDFKSGNIGVLLPKGEVNKEKIKYSCSGQNSNLTDPLFGFVE